MISQIADGVITFAGWKGSLGSDAVMASNIAKMRAQMAGLAASSSVNPYELFTDIIDGIEDVEIEDIADQLDELEFTQADVNESL